MIWKWWKNICGIVGLIYFKIESEEEKISYAYQLYHFIIKMKIEQWQYLRLKDGNKYQAYTFIKFMFELDI